MNQIANTNQDESALDTPASLAELLNTTPQTILNWFHAGHIPAKIAVGRLIRFDRQEALAALERRSESYAEQWERAKPERKKARNKRKEAAK
jgi:excisionase family DNA binding protein